MQKAIEIVKEDNERRENLIANGEYFRTKLRDAGFDIGNSSTHIVPIVVGSNEHALRFSKGCKRQGLRPLQFVRQLCRFIVLEFALQLHRNIQ